MLESAPRSDVAEGHRAGFLSRIAHRLDHVDVKVGATLVRRYDLRYAQSADTFRSLLAAVALYGNDAASASPRAPFVTSFAYHSNVAAGTTGWQLANWSWPAGITLVDATRQDKGVRLADVDGDARPDLVKALATLSNPDPKLATFSLSADSGVYLNTGSGFLAAKSSVHVLPTFPGQNGQIPFSLAWQDAYSSYTTGLDVLDVTGDGRADLVGGVRDLDPTSGIRRLYGMPTWYHGSANGFVAASDPGDVFDDGLWGMNRSGIVDLYVFTAQPGTSSGNARFADLTGDGLPELIVRGVEYRQTAIGGPSPPFTSFGWACLDERLTNYYFENRGELRFERAPVVDSAGPFCQSSLKRVATDFQQCDLSGPFADCGYRVLYNEAHPMQFAGDPSLGTFPWYWLTNLEFGAIDVDLDGDGLADTLSASFDPYQNGYGTAATAWRNDGERGYIEDPAWALPAGVHLYELGDHHSTDTGVRLADVNGDGRVDVIAREGGRDPHHLAQRRRRRRGDADAVGRECRVDDPGRSRVRRRERHGQRRAARRSRWRRHDGSRALRERRERVPSQSRFDPRSADAGDEPTRRADELRYEVSTQHDTTGGDGVPDLPFVVPVVASVSVSASPGQPGNLVSTTLYDYDGGLYDAAAREFRGFAGVTETRPDGRITVRVYHQTDALSGKLASETVLDAEGRPWLGVEYGYVADATPPYVGLVARVDRHEYDGQATPRLSRTEYRYDGGGAIVYGNPTAIIEWGEITGAATDAVPGDTRTTELSYLTNAALHLVDRVKTRAVRAGGTPGAGAVVRESHFAYDGDTSGVAPPTVGDLTSRTDVALRRDDARSDHHLRIRRLRQSHERHRSARQRRQQAAAPRRPSTTPPITASRPRW